MRYKRKRGGNEGQQFNLKVYSSLLPWIRNSFLAGHYAVWLPPRWHYGIEVLGIGVGLKVRRIVTPSQEDLFPYAFLRSKKPQVLWDGVCCLSPLPGRVDWLPERQWRARNMFSRSRLEENMPVETDPEALALTGNAAR
jgi:hypothetical protein